jgi:type IX secretion system PorP/SprF family membrane protein
MKKSIQFIFLFILSTAVNAQYYQYSQYNYASQRVNPGAISLSNYATAGFIYRRQDTSPDLKLNSFVFSAKYPIIAKNGGKRWSSIGFSVAEDQTGLGGVLVANELGLSYALNFATGENQTLSIGTKINYQSRKVNTDALFTGSQYVAGSGFGSELNSGEDFADFNTNFFSYSGGIIWQKNDRDGRRNRHLGISTFDINQPNESLFEGESPLPSTFVLEGGYRVFENQLLAIYPELLYTYSNAASALNIGAVTRYSLDDINPRTAGSAIELHTKYLLNEGVVLGIQFVREGLSIGTSYDIPLHRTVAHSGAFEIGLELNKLIESRYKVKKRNAKKIKRKRIKKVRKSKRKRRKRKKKKKEPDTKRKSETKKVKEIVTKNSEDNSQTIIEDKSITDLSEGSEEVNVTTTIGNIKHEPLLLEPTQLVYYFDFNSSNTEKETKNYLSDLIEILEKDEYIKIKIVGHTDNVGTEAYNMKLSKQRAKEISDQLLIGNIASDRIRSDGKGEMEPLSDNSTAEKRSQNRRVEITLYY